MGNHKLTWLTNWQSQNYYLRMPKFKHQIVLFIEPNDHEYTFPFKIGSKFMNLCAIDEDAGFEIVKILKLGKIRKPVNEIRRSLKLGETLERRMEFLEERKGIFLSIKCKVDMTLK